MAAETRARRTLGAGALLLAVALALPAAGADLLVVRVPVGSDLAGCAGCQILRLSPGDGGAGRVLTAGFAAARDPAVSFDGREVLFAGRREAGERWQIWRMDADGSHPEQLTHGPGDSTSPRWAGAIFHLDDDHPSDRFVYVSSVPGRPDENSGAPATAVFAAALDGGQAQPLTFNLGSDLEPDLLANGRIVFSSWRRDEVGAARQVLMAVNLDGTDLMPWAVAHGGSRFVHAVRVGSDGWAWLVESEAPGLLGGGDLAAVRLRRPLHGHRLVVGGGDGAWASPLPLADGSLLASFRRLGGDAPYVVWKLDPATGARLYRVAADPGAHLLAAAELTPHPRVAGRSSVVDGRREAGVFYCLSAHRSDRPGLARLAAATTLRVVEGRPGGAEGPEGPGRVVLGEVPLAEDGSFHVAVPARVPLAFELLDADGGVVARQTGWTWVMPNERRGCIGCHEDRELAPPNRLPAALRRPAVPLVRPPAETDRPPEAAP